MKNGVALGVGCVMVEHGGENDVERNTDDEQDFVIWVFEGIELGQQGDGNPGGGIVGGWGVGYGSYAANPRASLMLLVVKSSTYPEPVITCGVFSSSTDVRAIERVQLLWYLDNSLIKLAFQSRCIP